ncbi:hypothetical protein Taro_054462 [Colocasia esculenta]|uniref:Uncharacterized protein n=1 Tax=Colocasia esculenta TaxID=4460 RepID=A0A843XQK1_COLES|nr:hypothetical protein [Colocasia esculenta]
MRWWCTRPGGGGPSSSSPPARLTASRYGESRHPFSPPPDGLEPSRPFLSPPAGASASSAAAIPETYPAPSTQMRPTEVREKTPVAASLPEEVAEGTSDGGRDGFRSDMNFVYEVSSARSRLDLLGQLTSVSEDESDEDSYRPTIREQLAELVEDRVGDFSIPLGKKLKKSVTSLTISQRRNIKRQAYLNEVSRRNDSRFFAVIGAFVILPPIVILAVAILTGYVQLFP